MSAYAVQWINGSVMWVITEVQRYAVIMYCTYLG